jgi:hypothetical protein
LPSTTFCYGAIVGGLIVAVGNYWVTEQEANVKMVEIAIGILAAKPEENIKPARAWAVDVLKLYAPKQARLSEEVARALLDHPLPARSIQTGAWGTPFGAPFGPPPDQ